MIGRSQGTDVIVRLLDGGEILIEDATPDPAAWTRERIVFEKRVFPTSSVQELVFIERFKIFGVWYYVATTTMKPPES